MIGQDRIEFNIIIQLWEQNPCRQTSFFFSFSFSLRFSRYFHLDLSKPIFFSLFTKQDNDRLEWKNRKRKKWKDRKTIRLEMIRIKQIGRIEPRNLQNWWFPCMLLYDTLYDNNMQQEETRQDGISPCYLVFSYSFFSAKR